MKQTEITETRDLLDNKGHITKEGWSKKPFWQYDRKAVKASWLRIKEWDYYYVISPLSRGKITGNTEYISFSDKKIEITFEITGNKRIISFKVPELEMEGQLELTQLPDMDSMNIATSWAENRKQFYYNRKINCMPVSGTVKKGRESYTFNPEKDFAGLDWGRGYWPYKNRWFWSSCSCLIDGESFGFNLGYGFSDRNPASENMLFYKNKAHKLKEIQFHFDESDYVKPWRITSSDKRLELEFEPLFDRASSVNLLLIRSVQHQVFGKFKGTAVLDDGSKLVLDNLTGFAEDVLNYW